MVNYGKEFKITCDLYNSLKCNNLEKFSLLGDNSNNMIYYIIAFLILAILGFFFLNKK
jgi:LPXTG-motif cell wall-anchored protein